MTQSYLSHAGKKGMKWGYNDGRRNGKKTAEDPKEQARLDAQRRMRESNPYRTSQQDKAGREINKGISSIKSGVVRYARNEVGRYTDAARPAIKKTRNVVRKTYEFGKGRDRKMKQDRLDQLERSRRANEAKRKVVKKKVSDTKRKAEETKKDISAKSERVKKNLEYGGQEIKRQASKKVSETKKDLSTKSKRVKKNLKYAGKEIRRDAESAKTKAGRYIQNRNKKINQERLDQLEKAKNANEAQRKNIKKGVTNTKKKFDKSRKRVIKRGKKKIARILRKMARDIED